MLKNQEYRAARDFIKKYKVASISPDTLKGILDTLGYTVIYFNSISNTKQVEKLLKSIGMKDFSRNAAAFTYMDKNLRLVFLQENLSDNEQSILLCHELGHIVMDNVTKNTTIGQSIISEQSANEFAHYLVLLTKENLSSKLLRSPLKYSISLCTSSLLIFGVCIMLSFSVGNAYTDFQHFSVIPNNKNTINLEASNVENKDNTDSIKAGSFKTSPENLDELFDNNQPQILDEISIETTDETFNVKQQEIMQPEALQDFFYATKSGKKYHESYCSYVSGKENLLKIPKQNIDTSKYEPCSKCIK